MDIYENYHSISPSPAGCVVVLGNFDGLHKGHLSLLALARTVATDNTLPVYVVSFKTHPQALNTTHSNGFNITSFEDKKAVLSTQSVHSFIALDFNSIRSMSPHSFINDILINTLNAKHVCVGYDFYFGHNRSGNIETLKETTAFTSHILPPQHDNTGELYSSTRIRQYIQDGNINKANQQLGRNFTVSGTVFQDRQMGRKIQFPTANITIPEYVQPAYGVYAVKVSCPHTTEHWYDAIANFGVRPTVNSVKTPILETHIFNFDANLYCKDIQVAFVDFIRPEKRFKNIDFLQKQIYNDCIQAQNILSHCNTI